MTDVNRMIIALALLVGGLSSCGYKGSIRADQVHVVTPSGDRVAVDEASGAEPDSAPDQSPESVDDDRRQPGDEADGGAAALLFAASLPASVAVVGDSLALSAESEIEAVFDRLQIDIVEFDGLVNRRMARGGSELPPGVDAIEAILEESSPELWVIALGTNDVGSGRQPHEILADVAAVLELIPDRASVVWVDLWIGDLPTQTEEANDIIHTLVESRPDAVVADWHTHGAQPGEILPDGVHLTPAGRQEFADLIARAMVTLYAG